MHRAKRSFEKKLAKNIDKERRSFFASMRNRSRSNPMVGPLMDNQDSSAFHLTRWVSVEDSQPCATDVTTGCAGYGMHVAE